MNDVAEVHTVFQIACSSRRNDDRNTDHFHITGIHGDTWRVRQRTHNRSTANATPSRSRAAEDSAEDRTSGKVFFELQGTRIWSAARILHRDEEEAALIGAFRHTIAEDLLNLEVGLWQLDFVAVFIQPEVKRIIDDRTVTDQFSFFRIRDLDCYFERLRFAGVQRFDIVGLAINRRSRTTRLSARPGDRAACRWDKGGVGLRIVRHVQMTDPVRRTIVRYDDRVLTLDRIDETAKEFAILCVFLNIEIRRTRPPDRGNPAFRRIPLRDRIPAGPGF